MKDGDRVRPFAVGRAGGFCCITAAKGVGTFSLPPAAAGACGRRGGSDPADADRVSPRFALEAADLLAVDTAFWQRASGVDGAHQPRRFTLSSGRLRCNRRRSVRRLIRLEHHPL